MKYLERGGFQTHDLMRLTLGLACLLLAGFWVTNLVLFGTRLGFTSGSVAAYYLGAEGEFRSARTAASMLEVTHMHLPMMAVVVLLLTHLLIFAPWRRGTKVTVILVAFLSALADEGAGWLVRFVHPGFAWLKLVAFASLQGVLAILLVGLARFLWLGREREKAESIVSDEEALRLARRRRGY